MFLNIRKSQVLKITARPSARSYTGGQSASSLCLLLYTPPIWKRHRCQSVDGRTEGWDQGHGRKEAGFVAGGAYVDFNAMVSSRIS